MDPESDKLTVEIFDLGIENEQINVNFNERNTLSSSFDIKKTTSI